MHRLGDGAHRAEPGQLEQQLEPAGVHAGHCSLIVNGMSINLTWTRTVRAGVLLERMDTLQRLAAGTSMAVASMLCVQLGLAASVGPDRPSRRRGRGLAAAGLGRGDPARRGPAAPRATSRRATLAAGVALGRGHRRRDPAVHGRRGPAAARHGQRPGVPRPARRRRGPRARAAGRGLAAAGRGRRAAADPAVARRVDPVGVAFALAAAGCWAAYILLTQQVGDEVERHQGAGRDRMPVAALVATRRRRPEHLVGRLTSELLLVGLGLALLLPVVPFTLEMLALRRLTTAAFGTLMSLEPAFALVVGLVVLHQVPALSPVSASASWSPPGSAPSAPAPAPRSPGRGARHRGVVQSDSVVPGRKRRRNRTGLPRCEGLEVPLLGDAGGQPGGLGVRRPGLVEPPGQLEQVGAHGVQPVVCGAGAGRRAAARAWPARRPARAPRRRRRRG